MSFEVSYFGGPLGIREWKWCKASPIPKTFPGKNSGSGRTADPRWAGADVESREVRSKTQCRGAPSFQVATLQNLRRKSTNAAPKRTLRILRLLRSVCRIGKHVEEARLFASPIPILRRRRRRIDFRPVRPVRLRRRPIAGSSCCFRFRLRSPLRRRSSAKCCEEEG